MEFMILNRYLVEKISPEISYIVIGATEPNKPKPTIVKNKHYVSDLRLYFSDILEEDRHRYPSNYLFEIDHARILINFFLRNKKKAELCICQCDGGVSRSSAICAFLHAITGKNPDVILEHPNYAPNEHVYNFLNKIYRLEYY